MSPISAFALGDSDTLIKFTTAVLLPHVISEDCCYFAICLVVGHGKADQLIMFKVKILCKIHFIKGTLSRLKYRIFMIMARSLY